MYGKNIKDKFLAGLLIWLLTGTLLLSLGLSLALGEQPKGKLEVFHWWTEGGEKEAMHTMFDSFEAKYPGVKIVENPVTGGGGISLRAILTSKLAAGMPPDTTNELEGYRLKIYVDSGYLDPMDDIWEELNFEQKYLLDAKMMNVGGHYYGMPFHANRSNYVYYDKKLFEELNLKSPRDLDDLMTVCKQISKLKPNIYPIALGTRYKWPAIYFFDTILLSVGGVRFYKEFYTGKIDASKSSKFRKALEKTKELIPYIYKFHTSKSNFEADDMVVKGQAAMVIEGDWAYGRFIASGWEYGKQLGGWPFPDDIWIGHPDCYVRFKNAPNPKILRLWLKHLADAQTQINLSLIKGSTACIRGIEPDVYPEAVRRYNIRQLNDVSVPKLGNAFGGLATAAFVQDIQDILVEFLYNGEIDSAIKNTQKALIRDNVAEEMAWYWEY